MRFNTVITTALCSSAVWIGHVSADDLDDLGADTSSLSSVGEPSTVKSTIEKPTFTVSDRHLSHSYFLESLKLTLRYSPQISRHHSSSNLPMIGIRDGLPLMPKKRRTRLARNRKRNGRTWVNGRLRNRMFLKASKVIKVWWSRIKPLIMQSLQSSPVRLITRGKPWWFSMRSNFKVCFLGLRAIFATME